MIRRTGGLWDPSERNLFFIASSVPNLSMAASTHPFILVAVNELKGSNILGIFEEMLTDGVTILLDSGVYWLANEHKRAHGLTMDEALALAPEDIDGFDELWTRYVEMVGRYGDQVWGYIELDQGGTAGKRRTRAKLHDLGLSPIPVYHPLNDGRDYFDELAQDTDRLCWGNIVHANSEMRKHFLVTAWEYHARYPDLWIHMLGYRPNQWLNAYPVDSTDSSTWTYPVRWQSGYYEQAMLRPMSKMDPDYKYPLGPEAEGDWHRGLEMGAIGMAFVQQGWQHWNDRLLSTFGCDRYPESESARAR